jgi:2-amino-4-hydroxy-6-hydroxymethyldihydropteridine diphosphokinase
MRKIHFIAMGANLPGSDGAPPRAACEKAVLLLGRLPGVTACCRSRWFSTASVPDASQPRYINGMIRLEGVSLGPEALLAACQAIEAQAGRVRGEADAARTLDLDIIDMAGLVRAAPDPVLPHPRAHLRAFVLLPLRDVAPDWVHPVLRVGVGALLAGLRPQDVREA